MSDHTQLLHDIENQLEKLATAHTVLSDAIETEKRAGLVQAVTAGVGMATRGAQAVGGAVKEHFTQAKKGVGMMGEHFMDASPKGKLAVVGAAGAVGALSTVGARQEKQAESKLDAVKSILAKAKPSKGVQGAAAILASAQAGSMATNAVMNSGQNKQASDSEHAGNPTHYLRNMAIGAGLLTAPALLRAKALKGVIAKSESKIQSMAKEHRALLDHPNSALNAEPALFDENMAKVNDITQRWRQEANTLAASQSKDFGYAPTAIRAATRGAVMGATGEAVYSDHQNRDELYHPSYGRNMALTAGLVATAPATLVELGIGAGGAALATKLNSMRHAYREKKASDESNNGSQVGKYITGGGLAGAALAAPDALRGLKSLSKQKLESGRYDEARGSVLSLNEAINKLDITSPNYTKHKKDYQDLVSDWTKRMTDSKYNHAAANDFTSHMAQSARKKFLVGGGVGLAAVGAKQLWDINHQKQASDNDSQEQYSPHYARNAILTGTALATPDMARAYSSTAQGLDHRETFHEHSALSKRYLAEGDLINAAKYADSANTHKALAHQAELYTHNLGGSIGKRFAAGAALATAATGVNHLMHSGQTKSASLKAILQALETC